MIDDAEDKLTEEELCQQGVVRPYTLSDLAPPEIVQDGRGPWGAVEDDKDKQQSQGRSLLVPFRQGCPPMLIGGSAFGKGIFTDDSILQSTEPFRVVRLAFAYGLRAIDTSPFYHPSELSLGRILHALRHEFPRESMFIQTKAGRYGAKREHFDYSPECVRRSVQRSCRRLGTTYLDSVVMHDVEFVCHSVGPSQDEGFAARDLLTDRHVRGACGLSFDDQDDKSLIGKVHGPGDEKVLAAVQTLFALKDEGIVRNVGIGGYPLPVLLRLSRLVASTAPYRPLDVIVTYCNHTLQNDLLDKYASLFAEDPLNGHRKGSSGNAQDRPAWRTPMLINASPFAMGLLTDNGPPDWHPANEHVRQTCAEASSLLRKDNCASLAQTAAQFGLSMGHGDDEHGVPLRTIVGMNTVEQVHQAVESYRVSLAKAQLQSRTSAKSERLTDAQLERLRPAVVLQGKSEDVVRDLFRSRNIVDWTWSSP